ncbi:Guanylate-binding protein 4 [Sciurus carolinensis]|uniref:Guanylate-binding protein 4 n=1 Tax=Sciurus carolinensis TaxID=30640 RepID=A0AA41SXL5_SCICA|nr:Guanylate-binding protein 4 [Sciurus carolinensis]
MESNMGLDGMLLLPVFLNHLSNMTEMTDPLRARKSPDTGVGDADIVSFFPDFEWTLRDFYLSLEIGGQLMTADEYLENSLKTKQGSDQKNQTFNLPRLCIQKFFPPRKCFVFDSPTHKKLSQLETLQDDELSLEFVQQVAEFSSHIYTKSKIKTLPGGIKVTGPRLESLVLTYVSAINSGALPCMENAVLALAQRENASAVQKALSHYEQLMVQKRQLPTETLQELLDLHRASKREAIEIFTKNSFKDEDQSFQKELQGDPKNDSWIFALAVLLSSTLVYNSMGTINHQALEQLHYVTELTQLIRAKSDPTPDEVEDSTEFASFFPDFVWTVRDFTLELKLNGHPITEDEYLENALKLISGENQKIQYSNMSRECIRYFFPKRKCFVFDRPTNDRILLSHIDEVPQNQLERTFVVQSKNFCSYIFTNAKTKTLRGGILVTGNRLGTLAETYVNAINKGTIPCLEDAVTTLAQCENSAALQKAANHYSEQMAQRVEFPTDTLQELLEVHAACEREAIAVFMEHSFKDDKHEFQKKLVDTIERKKEALLLQNEEASVKYCQAQLEQLSEPLMQSISRGVFSVPGGHSLYLDTRKLVEQNYKLVPRKGVKAREVLQSFLEQQSAIEISILQSDKALTDGEKAIAAERAKKEAAEKEQELLRQQQKEQQERMEAQKRSFQENIVQLKEKMERERENILREQERVLEHKLKVQEELLMEGFKEKSERLNKEINRLKEEIETSKKSPSILSQILDTAGTVFLAVLPGVGKAVGAVMKVFSAIF